MDHRLHARFGLKWNPFLPDVPTSALRETPQIASFRWQVENHLLAHGGFAMVSGEPGTGKSAALRIVGEALSRRADLKTASLSHASASLSNFYREMAELFGVGMLAGNLWSGFKGLRESWAAHLDSTRLRPVLLIDEAQAAAPEVLGELRLLSSTEFDSRSILAVILAGDTQLLARMRRPDLLPLLSRVRLRLNLGFAEPADLEASLDHMLEQAGNPGLMDAELKRTLCAHCGGNLRSLTIMGDALLRSAAEHEEDRIDMALYFKAYPDTARARR